MRALTLRQPWADLVVAGVKPVENRTWQPPSTLPEWHLCECGHRERPRLGVTRLSRHHHGSQEWGRMEPDGPFPFTIAVHAGLSEEPDHYGRVWQAWRELDLRRPPHAGAVVGTVDVVGCHHADECGVERRTSHMSAEALAAGAREESRPLCSRWAQPDAYHWQLANPTALDEPVPARGQQRLWTLPDDVAATVLAS